MRYAVKVIVAIFLVGALSQWAGLRTLVSAEESYEGIVYLGGMGGHFAKAEVKIDPAASEPITVLTLSRVPLHGDPAIAKKAYGVHDARIDASRNLLFWSTNVLDGDAAHAGKVDLATGKVIADIKLPKDPRYKSGPIYCASGQTKDKYLIVAMGYEGYVDILDKETMRHERRVFFDHPKIPKNYVWAHGASSPDGKEFALWMSLSDTPGVFPRGKEERQLVFVLDMPALLKGEMKILREATLASDPKGGALFRGSYTSDGKHLLLSGRDRFTVLDAKSLKVVSETMSPAGVEAHDLLALPDNQYALVSLRVPVEIEPGKKVMDGQLQLFHLTRMEKVGKPASVCQACHKNVGIKTATISCGFDGVWKPQLPAAPGYP